jgi:hypothetical protein
MSLKDATVWIAHEDSVYATTSLDMGTITVYSMCMSIIFVAVGAGLVWGGICLACKLVFGDYPTLGF